MIVNNVQYVGDIKLSNQSYFLLSHSPKAIQSITISIISNVVMFKSIYKFEFLIQAINNVLR